jgi:hypothetical protein
MSESRSENPQSRGMTTRQAAAFWGVHYHTFRKLCACGLSLGPLSCLDLRGPSSTVSNRKRRSIASAIRRRPDV